jgi:hypothetical protein
MNPTEIEIYHAIELLREAENWTGKLAAVPIDPVCLWDDGSGPCGELLSNICILLQEKGNAHSVDAVAFCEHHTKCMQEGLRRWRTMA